MSMTPFRGHLAQAVQLAHAEGLLYETRGLIQLPAGWCAKNASEFSDLPRRLSRSVTPPNQPRRSLGNVATRPQRKTGSDLKIPAMSRVSCKPSCSTFPLLRHRHLDVP